MSQSGQDSDLSRLVVVKGETERKGLEEKGDSEGHSAMFKVPWTEAILEKFMVSTNSRDTREHAQCLRGYLPSIENQIGFVSRICGHTVGSDKDSLEDSTCLSQTGPFYGRDQHRLATPRG